MGADRADVSWRAQWWPPADNRSARGDGCDFVYWVERLRLGHVAQMLSASFDGARLFLRLAGQWSAGDGQPPAGDDSARTGWPGSQPDGGRDRQPIGQNYGSLGGISGYDAGKKVKGRKRHIITDTCGFLLFVLVHAADIQDRDGAPDVLKAIRFRFPWLRHVFADGGYAGDKLREALNGHGSWTLEIIKRSDTAKGFVLLPRRWVVERTFAWLGRCRRLAKDWERSIESSTAWANIASIRMLTRKIANLSTH